MKIPKLKDSRGHETITLLMIVPALIILMFKFATTDMSGLDFATAFVGIVGMWLTREYHEKVSIPKIRGSNHGQNES